MRKTLPVMLFSVCAACSSVPHRVPVAEPPTPSRAPAVTVPGTGLANHPLRPRAVLVALIPMQKKPVPKFNIGKIIVRMQFDCRDDKFIIAELTKRLIANGGDQQTGPGIRTLDFQVNALCLYERRAVPTTALELSNPQTKAGYYRVRNLPFEEGISTILDEIVPKFIERNVVPQTKGSP